MLRAALIRLANRVPRVPGKWRLLSLIRKVLYPRARTKVAGGFIMELDPYEWLQWELIAGRQLEAKTIERYREILMPGDTYVDVGSHVGFHALVARRLIGEEGRIMAVDPQPYNGDRLLNNFALNEFENIVMYVAAAGPVNGVARLRHQKVTDKARLSLSLDPVNDMPQRFCVPMSRLDRLFEQEEFGVIKLVKIDAEGYEPKVLGGIGDWFDRIEHLILEVLSPDAASTQAMLEGLVKIGYRLRLVTGERWQGQNSIPENNIWAERENAP